MEDYIKQQILNSARDYWEKNVKVEHFKDFRPLVVSVKYGDDVQKVIYTVEKDDMGNLSVDEVFEE